MCVRKKDRGGDGDRQKKILPDNSHIQYELRSQQEVHKAEAKAKTDLSCSLSLSPSFLSLYVPAQCSSFVFSRFAAGVLRKTLTQLNSNYTNLFFPFF